MVEQEKLTFFVPILGFLVMTFMMILVMVTHTSLYTYAGWTLDQEYQILMTLVVILGIVVPYIFLAINVVGLILYDKLERMGKIIGLVDIGMSIVLVIIAFAFVGYTLIIGSDNSPDQQAYFIADAALLIVGAIIGMLTAIGGVMVIRKTFLFWK